MISPFIFKKLKIIFFLIISFSLFLISGRCNNVNAASCIGSWKCATKDSLGRCTQHYTGGAGCWGFSDQNSCNNFSPPCAANECPDGGCGWSTSDITPTPPLLRVRMVFVTAANLVQTVRRTAEAVPQGGAQGTLNVVTPMSGCAVAAHASQISCLAAVPPVTLAVFQ